MQAWIKRLAATLWPPVRGRPNPFRLRTCDRFNLVGLAVLCPPLAIQSARTRHGEQGCMTRPTERRPAGPWLVSSLIPLNLFEPRIAKRFEAGAEEDRAVAQAKKLGCRLTPPSHLRLVKPNRIQRKIYPEKSAHTSMSPMSGCPRKADRSSGPTQTKQNMERKK